MHLEPPTMAWLLLGLCTVSVVVFLFAAHRSDFKQKVPLFYCWLGAIAVLGGAATFFLPIAVNSGFAKDDDGSALRQALLYTTGGLLGVITLGETHRKNNHEKEKNENDHTRQVYAERRSRYTKAVEQLANEKAAVRLGGIYTLVGLVDEWLADDSLAEDKQQEEGQVIINNLCSYIRSPFPLAEEIEEYEAHKELEKLQKTGPENLREAESSRLQVLLKRFENPNDYKEPEDITADYAKFHGEQDVRRTIFVEMSKRSSTFGEDAAAGPEVWSNFDFDFSRAPIFYPLNSITIEKGNFSSAKFYSNADFSRTTFIQDADFSRTTFTQRADFRWATFTQEANFRWAKFTRNAHFSWTKFTQTAHFSWTKFTQTAHFTRAKFTQKANFSCAIFAQNAYFWGMTFTQTASFSRATFIQDADFRWAIFTRTGYFRGTTFTQNADFGEATFKEISPKFVDNNEDPDKTLRARFAALAENQEAHNFTVRKRSQPIPLGEAELDGVKYRLPVGTVLFDSSSGKTSEPAKPLDDSDEAEEDKTE